MNKYLVAEINNIYNEPVYELIDISYTNMPEEGIIEFVNNVYKFKNYDIWYTPLDFDHFKLLKELEWKISL